MSRKESELEAFGGEMETIEEGCEQARITAVTGGERGR